MTTTRLRLYAHSVLTLLLYVTAAIGDGSASDSQAPRLARALEKPVVVTGTAGDFLRALPTGEAEPVAEWHVVRFTVDRVLKGSIPAPKIEVRFLTSSNGTESRGVRELPSVPAKGRRALLCLNEPQGADSCYVLPPDFSCVVRLSPTQPSLTGDEDALSIIKSEVLVSLRFQGADETRIRLSALEALRMYRILDVTILRELRLLSASDVPLVRVESLAGRVRSGEYDALPELLVEVEDWEPTAALPPFLVADALESVRSAEGLPGLRSFLESLQIPDESRRSAAYAIAYGIDDDRAVPSLVGLLSDKDPQVQLTAIHGLYRIEKTDRTVDLPGADYAPGAELFEANPDKYLNNWRQWWATTGRLKYAHVLSGN